MQTVEVLPWQAEHLAQARMPGDTREQYVAKPVYDLTVGGRGAAKTRAAAMLAHLWLEGWRACNFGVFADTFGKLQSNFLEEFRLYLSEIGWQHGRDYTLNRQQVKFTCLHTGSTLQGFSMDKPPEKTKGPTLHGLIGDETDTIGEQHYSIFEKCVRGERGPQQTFLFANAAPMAHWLNRRFAGSGKLPNHHLRRVSTYRNSFLTRQDIEKYEADYPPGSLAHKRWMLGLAVATEGAVYPEFDPAVHVVESVPKFVAYIESIDLGIVDPTVWHLWGIDSGGVMWCIDEYVSEPYDSPQDQAASILPRSRTQTRFSDHSLTHRTAFEHEGLLTIMADKDRARGHHLVRRRLKNRGMFLLKGAAPLLEESFQLYEYKPGTHKEETVHTYSHAVDSARYAVCGLEAGAV